MAACRTLSKEMLLKPIEVHSDDEELDLHGAQLLADRKAREQTEDPMLLAWFMKKTGEHSPRVECCSEEKPGWLVYAESRGGKIVVDINDMEYVFVYCS